MALFNIIGIHNTKSSMFVPSEEFLTQFVEAKKHKALTVQDKDFLDVTGIMEIECSFIKADCTFAYRRSNK